MATSSEIESTSDFVDKPSSDERDTDDEETLQLKKQLEEINKKLKEKKKEKLRKEIKTRELSLQEYDYITECENSDDISVDLPNNRYLSKKKGNRIKDKDEKEYGYEKRKRKEKKAEMKEKESTNETKKTISNENYEFPRTSNNTGNRLITEPDKMKFVNLTSVDESVIESFVAKIGLASFYPNKLQLSDVMKVVSNEDEVKLSQFGIRFLRNLIMLNYLSRDKMVQDLLRQIPSTHQTKKSSKKIACIDDLLGNDSENTTIIVSPLDLLLAVFKCSSPILQQVLTTKLFLCQLAVPLILPPLQGDPCKINVWPLRSISVESKTDRGITQDNAVTRPSHVVSFIRIGRPSISKSKLLNEILTDQYHNSFMNKDCPLGGTKRSISNGLVEASWYLPSKKSSTLANVTMFLNLRGDSCCCKSQFELLTQISNVIVVVLDVKSLCIIDTIREIIGIQNSKSCLLLAIDAKHHKLDFVKEQLQCFLDKAHAIKSMTEICILSKDGEDRSTSLIKEKMLGLVHSLLDTQSVVSLINRVEQIRINTDEDASNFQRTKSDAKDIITLIPEHLDKTRLVPLQGKLWCSLSNKTKEVNKSSQNHTLQEQGKIRQEMLEYRKQQAKICEELGDFMSLFLSSMQNHLPSGNDLSIFISWLKIFLDERSRKVIPRFLSKYQSDWQKLMAIREKKDIPVALRESLRKAVNDSEVNLAEASFGFEHLCREMGQIYEALTLKKSKTSRTDLVALREDLPKMAAQLLLLGQPFEIMDGDAANVPILWVNAVLKHLKKTLGDKRMLALSVLGIQSSGKSTLLNAMFGLQFAVSAGRCTRGVFMQLVPVEGKELPFDIVLVIDTEGLRAPELAQQKYTHDNELATFVIGLGDITIVNIKGENTAEVKDVLQIAVHAFLRLMLANQDLNLKQRCVFVHQNVPALDANDKMMHGRQKFIETLDAMTKEAADQENIAEIQSFSQVIEFDCEKSVWYFSDLWRGDPPMAPVNPGYSESVSMVKDAILYHLTKGRETYLTISDTISRIEDLWEGILKDDFVFSFRNSLEFKAYANIERQYHNLIWEIEKYILEFVTSDVQMIFANCENENELHLSVPDIVEKLNKEVQKLVSSLLKELESFIETNSLKDVMIQWKQSKINRIRLKAEELIAKAKVDINNTKEEMRIQKLKTSEQRKHEMEINEKAKELALSMKGETPSEKMLKQKFEQMWKTWMSKFNTQDITLSQGIGAQIKSHIWDRYASFATFLNDDWEISKRFNYGKILKLEGSFPVELMSDNCLAIHTLLAVFKRESPVACKKKALEITNKILRRIDTKLQEHRVEDTRFDISYVSGILKVIEEEICEHNSNKRKEFHFNLLKPYHSRLICHVAGYASIYFANLQEAYNKKHSPKAQMEAYKSTVWMLFKNTVDSKTEEVIAMGFFKEAITRETKAYVSQLLPIDTQDKILSEFSNGKYSLIKQILKDVADSNDFRQLTSYIKDPSGFAEVWISDLVDAIMFNKSNDKPSLYCKLAEKRINRIFNCLADGICKATNTFESGIHNWIQIFVGYIRKSKELPLSKDVLVHVEQRKIEDCNSFGSILLDELDKTKELVLEAFKWQTGETVTWTSNPVSNVMTKLWGCTDKCMFCKEPCMNTDENHVVEGHPHKCLQHRPEGISGFIWEESERLVVDFCNHLVDSEKKYRFGKKRKFQVLSRIQE